MNQLTDEQLDKVLGYISEGISQEEVLTMYPEHRQEILDIWSISLNLSNLPIKPTPRGYKHYRFKEYSRQKFSIKSLFTNYKLAAIPLTALIVMFASNTLLSFASNSLPGDSLYSLKRASEKAQLNFTFDNDKLTNLQIELAQKRLEETKQALLTGTSEQKIAAITELNNQVENTFKAIPATKTNSQYNILDNLISLNKAQQTILSEVVNHDSSQEVKTLANNLSTASQKSLVKIIAASNDQVLAESSKISETGNPSNVTPTAITLNKQLFIINKNTIVSGQDGDLIAEGTKISGKITVNAVKQNNELIAKRIILIPEVKTAIIPTIEKTTKTQNAIKNTENKPSSPNTEPQQPEVETSAKVTGGFIAEPKF